MPTDQEMMTLAAITYRGFNLVLPEKLKRAHLRRAMENSLADLSEVIGKWQIVWGPASFSPVAIGLDDALMYVVQSADERYLAIAIRGTNPISPLDWLFEDLMVTQVPWEYPKPAGIPDAKISESSKLGLGILQSLRWDEAEVRAVALPAVTTLASLDNLYETECARLKSITPLAILKTIISKLRLPNMVNLARLNLVPDTQPPGGTDLKGFLRSYLSTHPKAEICVTGHSMGGAMSPTLALWLADTRGTPNEADRWTSDPKTPVHAWSFAGPTAGNQQFAAHSNLTLTGCHRIWNKLDVVPYAFAVSDLRKISALYKLDLAERVVLEGIINTVAAEVTPLNYTQICADGEPFSVSPVPDLPLPLQLVHQHLDSYLKQQDLIDRISAATLFAPVL